MNEPSLKTTPPRRLVIYHSADFDGEFCREIARRFLPGLCSDELLGWDYGDPVPAVDPATQLWILDLSIEGLMDHPNLVWIDHHRTALEKYSPDIRGYRLEGVAACRLAWQWFDHEYASHVPGHQIGYPLPTKHDFVERMVGEPLAVRLAGEYDVWDQRDPRAELFQHGLRSRPLTNHEWSEFLSPASKLALALCEVGVAIRYASQQRDKACIQRAGFTLRWEGLCFLACNAALFNSHLFTAGLQPQHQACLGFGWDGREWRISLYHAPGHERHNLSSIAAKYGGGGHPGACGFRCAQLPFPLTPATP